MANGDWEQEVEKYPVLSDEWFRALGIIVVSEEEWRQERLEEQVRSDLVGPDVVGRLRAEQKG